MALTSQRIGEIALVVLQDKLEKDGSLRLNPIEIKRDATNGAKRLGVPPSEAAEFMQMILKVAYDKTIAALDELKDSQTRG